MKKTTTTGPVYNGPVHVEVTADTPEKALAIAKAISGLSVKDEDTVIKMEGDTWILSGVAKNVTNLPQGVTLWPKSTKQMHT